MKIPKIIHHTWKDYTIPEHLLSFYNSWKRHHPDWEFKLWTDEMNRNFLAQHFPHFIAIYDHYPFPIQKVDAVRYFILLTEGGVFIDLDFECMKNIEPLLASATFAIGKEPKEHAIAHEKEYILSNAFMASTPQHDFLKQVCNRLQQHNYMQHRYERGYNMVLDCAGPFMLGRCYEAYNHKEDLIIIEAEYLYPLVKDHHTGSINRNDFSSALHPETYAVHHYWGSWWKG